MPDVQNVSVDLSIPYVANRTFDYLDDVKLCRGEVFNLRPAANNEKLIRLDYVAPFREKDGPFACRYCGKKFSKLALLNEHGRIWHPDVEDTSKSAEVRELERMERIERTEERVAPLAMDRTAASLDPAAALHDVQATKKSKRKYR